jgi:hypothetical protein
MKALQENHRTLLVWPQLDVARIVDALNPNMVQPVSADVGGPILPDNFVMPPPEGDEVIKFYLKHSASTRLNEQSEDTFLATSYMEQLCDSDCFSGQKRKDLWNRAHTPVDYDSAPGIDPIDTLLALRTWIHCNEAPADRWLWKSATLEGSGSGYRGAARPPRSGTSRRVASFGVYQPTTRYFRVSLAWGQFPSRARVGRTTT